VSELWPILRGSGAGLGATGAQAAVTELNFRRYRPTDADPVWHLHEWALEEAGTDPADLPGVEDLRAVGATYLDEGDFVVGVGAEARRDERPLRTDDGVVVAMGGFLPSEAGHEDERTVAGAAELHRMRVAPTRQGSGHGRALLETLEKRAAAAGFDRLLATTAARQAAAVGLYESAGYDRVGASGYGEYELRHFEKRLG